MSTQLLSFVDHFMMIDFTGFDEMSLIEHIVTCDQIVSSLEHFYVNLLTKQIEYGDRINFTGNNNVLFISPAVLDAISSVCFQSAKVALHNIISSACETRKHLLVGFLKEYSEGWIGGILCNALVNSINHWLEYIEEQLPERFARLVCAETCHYFVKVYIQNMINHFKGHKNLVLTSSGIKQIKDDLNIILMWINKVTHGDEGLSIKEFLKVAQSYLECSDVDALQIYAKSVLAFGSKYDLHLYDLFRLLLKYRSNINPKTRKAILALCGEFSSQLKKSTNVDPKLLDGSFNDVMIFDTLFQMVGLEHCTGSKWKIEKPADPEAIRLSVTLTISDTCNNAVSKRRQSSIILPNHSSIQQQDSFKPPALQSTQSQSLSRLFPTTEEHSFSKESSLSSFTDSSVSTCTTPQSTTTKKKPLPPIPMKKTLSSSLNPSPIPKTEEENISQSIDSLNKDCFLKVSTVLQENIKEDNSPTKPLTIIDESVKTPEINDVKESADQSSPNSKLSPTSILAKVSSTRQHPPPPPPPPPPRRATILTLPSQEVAKQEIKEEKPTVVIAEEKQDSQQSIQANSAAIINSKPPPPPPKPSRRASAPVLGSCISTSTSSESTLTQEQALALLLEKSKANLTF